MGNGTTTEPKEVDRDRELEQVRPERNREDDQRTGTYHRRGHGCPTTDPSERRKHPSTEQTQNGRGSGVDNQQSTCRQQSPPNIRIVNAKRNVEGNHS